MAYVVLKSFVDLQDNHYAYKVGDEFPHLGVKVSDERIKELSGYDNRQRTPLIKEVTHEHSDGVVSTSEKLVRPRKKKVVRTDNDN